MTSIIWSVSRRKYEASWTSILSSSHDTSVPSTGLLLACEVHFWNLWSRDGNCESVLDNFSPVPSVVILGSVIAIFSILFMFISRSAPISGSIVRVFTRTKKRCDSPPITDKIGTIIIQPNPFYDGDSPYLRPTTPLHTTCWSQYRIFDWFSPTSVLLSQLRAGERSVQVEGWCMGAECRLMLITRCWNIIRSGAWRHLRHARRLRSSDMVITAICVHLMLPVFQLQSSRLLWCTKLCRWREEQ